MLYARAGSALPSIRRPRVAPQDTRDDRTLSEGRSSRRMRRLVFTLSQGERHEPPIKRFPSPLSGDRRTLHDPRRPTDSCCAAFARTRRPSFARGTARFGASTTRSCRLAPHGVAITPCAESTSASSSAASLGRGAQQRAKARAATSRLSAEPAEAPSPCAAKAASEHRCTAQTAPRAQAWAKYRANATATTQAEA